MKVDAALLILILYILMIISIPIFQLIWGRFRLYLNDFYTIGELLLWAQELEISLDQLRAIYDWRIKQWSSSSKVILTSTLAFSSAMIIGIIKHEMDLTKAWQLSILCAANIISLIIYFYCLSKTIQLRRKFNYLLTLLSILR